MTDRSAAGLTLAAAYREVTLTELRALFDQIDVDLEDLWERERETDRELTGIGGPRRTHGRPVIE